MGLQGGSFPRVPVINFANAAARAAYPAIQGDLGYQIDTKLWYSYDGASWNKVADVTATAGASMALIEHKDLTASGAVSFSSISGYKYLVLDIHLVADASRQVALTFNDDSGNNYNYQDFTSGAASSSTTNSASVRIATPSASIDVMKSYLISVDALGTENRHACAGLTGYELGAYAVNFNWKNAAAITKITLTPAAGNLTGVATLWGIKSA